MWFNTCKKLPSFGQQKVRNIRNYLKAKSIQENAYLNKMEDEDKTILENSHRMLFSIYGPALLLAAPTVYFFADPVSPMFLQSLNILQYYSSGILCFNTFFPANKKKIFIPFLMGVSLVNVIPDPYSIISPIILGGLGLYFPMRDEQAAKRQSEEELQKLKLYAKLQGIYYFIIVVILTLKAYHFISLNQLIKKLSSYQQQNDNHFQLN